MNDTKIQEIKDTYLSGRLALAEHEVFLLRLENAALQNLVHKMQFEKFKEAAYKKIPKFLTINK